MFAVLGLMLWHILYQWDQFTWYHVGSTNLRAGHVNSLYKFLFISFVIMPVVSTSKLNSHILSQMFYWCCLVVALTLKHSVPAPVQLDFFCFSWREKKSGQTNSIIRLNAHWLLPWYCNTIMLSSLLCFTHGIQFPPSCHRPIHFSIRNKRAHCDQKAARAHHVHSDFEAHEAHWDETIWFSYMIGTVLLLYSTKGDFKTSAFVGTNPQRWVKVGICVQTLKKGTGAVTGTLPMEKVQKPLIYHVCNQ